MKTYNETELGKLFRQEKQPTDRTCQHTCLAMITGNTVEYVIKWFGDYGDMPLCSEDTIVFLAHHGVYLAIYAEGKDGKYLNLSKGTSLDISITLKHRPALLAVISERFEDTTHAVFWDGMKVLDPSPLVKEPRTLESYKIIEYWPLLFTEQQFNRIDKAMV